MNRELFRLLVSSLVAVYAGQAHAATAVWSGAANNKWDTSSANWTRGGTPNSAYVEGDDVVFDDSSSVTNINIAQVVNPGSVLITNSSARVFMFTNAIISGACGVVKAGNGTVYFGSPLAGNMYYTNSFLFSGGTIISNGALRFIVGTNSAGSYASGGSAIGFGTGTIRLEGATATLGLTAGTNLNAAVVLTNRLVVGTGGGVLNIPRIGAANPQHNIRGDIDLYGGFSITNNGNIGNGISGAVIRVMAPGITKLYNSSTVTVEGASSSGGVKSYWEQNITQDAVPVKLTICGGTEVGMVDFTGDNTGMTGGVEVRKNGTLETGAIVFTSTNAMGGGSFTIGSNAYAGLAFGFSSALVTSLVYESDAVLGIDSNSSVNIDLATMGTDIWMGSARGAIYSGTLTPYGSTYKLAGGGTKDYNPLVLINTNALTGSRTLLVGGTTNSVMVPGAVALAAPNDYTGGTEITGSKRGKSGSIGDARLIVRSEGALGPGPILMKQLVSGGPGLFYEMTAPTMLTNSLVLTGSVSAATVSTTNRLTFRGDLTVYGTKSMNINALNVGQPLTVFDQAAAGKTVTFATGGYINQDYGLFDPGSPANFPTNIGYRQNANGTLLLSAGFSWNDFVTGRSGVNNSAPGAGQYQARAFAARGSTQIIDDAGPYVLDKTGSPWLLGPFFGSDIRESDGSFYANAGVKVVRSITTTNVLFTVTVTSTGPGYTNSSSSGVVHELGSNIGGIGSVAISGRGTYNAGQVPELVMSGTNTWIGNYNGDLGSSQRIMSGPGGMGIVGSQPAGYIRFDGNGSFPTGNGGLPSYLMALGRANRGLFGYLLTGGETNRTYTLPAGYSFLLGGGDGYTAALGAALGKATLAGSTVNIFLSNAPGTANSTNQYLALPVRDAASTFTLGSASAPVRFCNVYAAGTSLAAGWYDSSSNATAMVDRPNSVTRLEKWGAGTLVLSNLVFTLVDGVTDNSSKFTWQIGSGVTGWFDGVVRETGTGPSNSLRNVMSLNLNGGIMGLASDFAPVLGTNSLNGAFFSLVTASSGVGVGFAAYGGKRTVTLTPFSNNSMGWGTTVHGQAAYFMNAGSPLLLSAPDADAPIVLASAYTNMISLSSGGTGPFEIRVYDNPATNTDEAIIGIRITGGAAANGIVKTGSGSLSLTATNNDWLGKILISNGTFNVNGAILAGASNVFVYSGATLGGTGTISRTINVMSGGTVSAGAGTNETGTLTISSNLVLNTGSSMVVDLAASGNDQLVVNGSGSLDLSGCSLVVAVAGGYTAPAGNITILTMPNGTISGSFTSVTKGYKVTISGDGKTLYLRRDSPGFIFRIQ